MTFIFDEPSYKSEFYILDAKTLVPNLEQTRFYFFVCSLFFVTDQHLPRPHSAAHSLWLPRPLGDERRL